MILLQAAEISNQVTQTGIKINEMGVVPSMLFLAVLVLSAIVVYQYKSSRAVDSSRIAEQAKVYEDRLSYQAKGYEDRIADQAKVYEARIADLKDALRK